MIIGLNGAKGAGKDTAGAYLRLYGFETASFAAKLKESAAACFGVDAALWEELKNEGTNTVALLRNGEPIAEPTVRQFLQFYGTEAHRDVFGSDFWVDQLFKTLDLGDQHYAITDARFDNELDAVHAEGGITIRIERDKDTSDMHISEAAPGPKKIDYTVFNYGTYRELYEQLDNIMDALEISIGAA